MLRRMHNGKPVSSGLAVVRISVMGMLAAYEPAGRLFMSSWPISIWIFLTS